MTYTVTSDSFVPAERGATVSDDQLAGCDIPALLAAGHLVRNEPTVAAPPAAAVEPSTPPVQPPADPAANPQEQ